MLFERVLIGFYPSWIRIAVVPNAADAQRAMTIAQEVLEARHKTWIGRSTVRTFGAGTQFQLTQSTLDVLADWVSAEVAEQARKSGYGNAFEAIRTYVPWRVALYSEQGQALYPTPRPGGPLTATVVGPHGETRASGAGEIHTDRLGRIRIRFDFQDSQVGIPEQRDRSFRSIVTDDSGRT